MRFEDQDEGDTPSGIMDEMSLRDASNGLVRRLYKIHLSPYQKFKKRALS